MNIKISELYDRCEEIASTLGLSVNDKFVFDLDDDTSAESIEKTFKGISKILVPQNGRYLVLMVSNEKPSVLLAIFPETEDGGLKVEFYDINSQESLQVTDGLGADSENDEEGGITLDNFEEFLSSDEVEAKVNDFLFSEEDEGDEETEVVDDEEENKEKVDEGVDEGNDEDRAHGAERRNNRMRDRNRTSRRDDKFSDGRIGLATYKRDRTPIDIDDDDEIEVEYDECGIDECGLDECENECSEKRPTKESRRRRVSEADEPSVAPVDAAAPVAPAPEAPAAVADAPAADVPVVDDNPEIEDPTKNIRELLKYYTDLLLKASQDESTSTDVVSGIQDIISNLVSDLESMNKLREIEDDEAKEAAKAAKAAQKASGEEVSEDGIPEENAGSGYDLSIDKEITLANPLLASEIAPPSDINAGVSDVVVEPTAPEPKADDTVEIPDEFDVSIEDVPNDDELDTRAEMELRGNIVKLGPDGLPSAGALPDAEADAAIDSLKPEEAPETPTADLDTIEVTDDEPAGPDIDKTVDLPGANDPEDITDAPDDAATNAKVDAEFDNALPRVGTDGLPSNGVAPSDADIDKDIASITVKPGPETPTDDLDSIEVVDDEPEAPAVDATVDVPDTASPVITDAPVDMTTGDKVASPAADDAALDAKIEDELRGDIVKLGPDGLPVGGDIPSDKYIDDQIATLSTSKQPDNTGMLARNDNVSFVPGSNAINWSDNLYDDGKANADDNEKTVPAALQELKEYGKRLNEVVAECDESSDGVTIGRINKFCNLCATAYDTWHKIQDALKASNALCEALNRDTLNETEKMAEDFEAPMEAVMKIDDSFDMNAVNESDAEFQRVQEYIKSIKKYL